MLKKARKICQGTSLLPFSLVSAKNIAAIGHNDGLIPFNVLKINAMITSSTKPPPLFHTFAGIPSL